MYIASLLVLLGEGKISLANEERKWERAIGNISKAINFFPLWTLKKLLAT